MQVIQSENTSVVYGYSSDLGLLSASTIPAIAISCFVDGKANDGLIGFGCSEAAEAMRWGMVSNRLHYDGENLYLVNDPKQTFFAPRVVAERGFTIKTVSQTRNQLSNEKKNPRVTQVFRSRFEDLFVERRERGPAKTPLHKDVNFFGALAELHIEYGLELQVWPYLTPYESFCILFGKSQSDLLEQIENYFESRSADHRLLEGSVFPVY